MGGVGYVCTRDRSGVQNAYNDRRTVSLIEPPIYL